MVARHLLARAKSKEPLHDVVSAFLNSLDQLTHAEYSEVLVELGRRARRDGMGLRRVDDSVETERN
jgi:hypothetical protein